MFHKKKQQKPTKNNSPLILHKEASNQTLVQFLLQVHTHNSQTSATVPKVQHKQVLLNLTYNTCIRVLEYFMYNTHKMYDSTSYSASKLSTITVYFNSPATSDDPTYLKTKLKAHLSLSLSHTQTYIHTYILTHTHTHTHTRIYIEGFWPEWCISTIYHAWDIPFWLGTLDIWLHDRGGEWCVCVTEDKVKQNKLQKHKFVLC